MAKTYYVCAPVADVREKPDAAAPRGKFESQLIFGETFVADEEHGLWVKGRCGHDQYPGFVEKNLLTETFNQATHVVADARAHIYKDASIKSALITTLSLGSLIHVVEQGEKFAKLENGTYIYSKHIVPVGAPGTDHVAAALKFLETPYQWGGRSGFGIDCSGLVQVALAFCGVAAPRDTDQQIIAIGQPVSDTSTLKHGDIVFFPGHVGIMTDDNNILHANAFHMKTVMEPLSDVVARSSKNDGKGITAARRI